MRANPARRGERGATAVIVGLLLVVLAMFLGLVINTGHMHLIRTELQTATDAAALAGAKELNGTQAGIDAAVVQASNYARAHETDNGMPVALDPGDVIFGHWDDDAPRSSAFTRIDTRDPPSLSIINAVVVQAGRQVARGNAMKVDMGGLFTKKQQDVAAEACAVLGGPCELGCAIPIAFAACIVKNPDGSLNCGTQLTFNSDVTDNIGFTNLTNDPSVSTSRLREILSGENCHVLDDQYISISNGANLSPLVNDFEPFIGHKVSAPVVDLGECPAKFNEHQGAPIVGFATFTILQVTGGATKSIVLQMDCEEILSQPLSAGCEFFGTSPLQPRLVR
jgi:hypothetical protein